MKTHLVDLLVFVGAFAISTVVVYWLRGQGVDVPTLPDWVTGL
jgi:hypothetical protein